MKSSKWINAYENNNVDIGLSCGFSGKAQIGKGMWAMPDQMANMMDQKIGHPKSGANCAWVPSPTAATLHSMHYHKVNVFDEQNKIRLRDKAKVENILEIPKADRPNWSIEDIKNQIFQADGSVIPAFIPAARAYVLPLSESAAANSQFFFRFDRYRWISGCLSKMRSPRM